MELRICQYSNTPTLQNHNNIQFPTLAAGNQKTVSSVKSSLPGEASREAWVPNKKNQPESKSLSLPKAARNRANPVSTKL
jgi:hypothetical protein